LCESRGIAVPDGSRKNHACKRLEIHEELIKGTKPGEKRKITLIKKKGDFIEEYKTVKRRKVNNIFLNKGEVLRKYNIYNNNIIYASNFGRVFQKNEITRELVEILPRIEKGYATVAIEHKNFRVHRLVAEVYCEVPESLKDIPIEKLVVNHIDENKLNNIYYNLEWLTIEDNVTYGTANLRKSITTRYGESLEIKNILEGKLELEVFEEKLYNRLVEASLRRDYDLVKELTLNLEFCNEYKKIKW
jgi:hypothetical protein